MTELSEVDLLRIFTDAKHATSMDDPYRVTNGLHAVADAAIAADRAARAEPVAYRLSYEFMGKNREILTESVVVADAIKECRPCVIEPLCTTPPAAPVVPEWQPIETAPQDGSIFLVGAIGFGYWVTMAFYSISGHLSEALSLKIIEWPTHWMPLPAPPAAAHEAKRVSCSQTAKKSTCEGGRVDETGKSEHVGGAA